MQHQKGHLHPREAVCSLVGKQGLQLSNNRRGTSDWRAGGGWGC